MDFAWPDVIVQRWILHYLDIAIRNRRSLVPKVMSKRNEILTQKNCISSQRFKWISGRLWQQSKDKVYKTIECERWKFICIKNRFYEKRKADWIRTIGNWNQEFNSIELNWMMIIISTVRNKIPNLPTLKFMYGRIMFEIKLFSHVTCREVKFSKKLLSNFYQ